MKNFKWALLMAPVLLCSCFSAKVVTQTKIEKQTDTLSKDPIYKEVVKEILKPVEVEKFVYSNCNDTAYLLTIQTLNRKLDSAKTKGEMRTIIRQTKQILSNRDDRELKEQKEANKLLISQLEERNKSIEQLRKMLKEKEKTQQKEIKASAGGCSHFKCYLIMGLLALICVLLLRIRT